MKKKWKKTIGMICVKGLVMCLTAGCGKDAAGSPGMPMQETQQNNVVDGAQADNAAGSPGMPTQETQQNNVVDGAQVNNTAGDGEFYDGANLEGSVVEFSETGFSLSPATTENVEGGGQILAQAAPGSERDEDNIQITYTDNTIFQIVNLSLSSQSELSREMADKESVKKQTEVCVFGSCQDTNHWTADKILILRWQ